MLILKYKNIGSNPDDLKYLADGIKNNTSIKVLNLTYNKIDSNTDDQYIEEMKNKGLEVYQ